MDDISLALHPPRFKKFRRPPIRLSRSPERVWPLAALNGRAPVVLDTDEPGIDLAYPRVDDTDAIDACSIGSPFGTATHIMPAMTAALAVDDGVREMPEIVREKSRAIDDPDQRVLAMMGARASVEVTHVRGSGVAVATASSEGTAAIIAA